MKVLASHWTSSDTTPIGVLDASLQTGEVGTLGALSGLCWCECEWNQFSLGCSFVLLGCSFHGPQTQENRLWFGFFLSMNIGIYK